MLFHKNGFFNRYDFDGNCDALNRRYDAIIGRQKEIYNNATVLDIGCYDGRWTFAAHKAGAFHVTGVDNHPVYLNAAKENLVRYNVPPHKYTLVETDIFDFFKTCKADQFDVVLLLGILHHIINVYELFEQINRINKNYLIIDTDVNLTAFPNISCFLERGGTFIGSYVQKKKGEWVISGIPSRSCISLFLNYFNYTHEYCGLAEHVDVDHNVGHNIVAIARKSNIPWFKPQWLFPQNSQKKKWLRH